MNDIPHTSVLLSEFLQTFEGRDIRRFIDGTAGAGGHSLAILQAHPEIEQLVALDRDASALELAKKRLEGFGDKVSLVKGNFCELLQDPDALGTDSVDGIFLDLGVSSMHLDRGERGFSFSRQGPLDMRMDTTAELTAEIIVNEWPEEELGRVFREYGEERRWRAAARRIVSFRKEEPITTTMQLAKILEPVLRPKNRKAINPLTLVFQALRIATNDELGAIETALPAALQRLRPGGILGVISFHSLEDRIVKKFFRQAASDKQNTEGLSGLFLDKEPEVNLLTPKPIVALEEEIAVNPRSRSAKMRFVEKL